MKMFYTLALAAGLTASLGAFETYKEAIAAGVQAAKDKKFAEAVKNFDEAEKLSSNVNEKYNALMNKAGNQRNLKKWDDSNASYQAIADMEDATAQQIANAKYQKTLNYVWSSRRKEVLPALIELGKDSSLSMNQRAEMYLQAGEELRIQRKFDESIEQLKATEAFENLPPTYAARSYVGLSRCYQEKQDFPAAQEAVDKALSYEKADKWVLGTALLRRGEIYQADKKIDEAIEAFRKLADNSDMLLDARGNAANNLGNALFNQKKYDEAVEAFQKILQIEKVNPYYSGLACMGLARSYLALKKYDDAAAIIEKGNEFKSASPWIAYSLAYSTGTLLDATQKYEEAIAAYNGIHSLKGLSQANYDQTNLAIANVYFNRLKDNDKAKEYYEKAAKSNTAWIKNSANAQLKKIQ